MVYTIGVQSTNSIRYNAPSFKAKAEDKKSISESSDVLLYNEKKRHPITTNLKIQTDKITKAFSKYPKKGLKGSKNANFYEFLTMGIVPYLAGSATLISVFNLASKFFDTPAAKSAGKLGKKMGLGVLFYGIAKTVSKKLIEVPLNMKYGIDVNLPYKKKIDELPEEDNKDNLVALEYHKAYESVDFPRWDLFYDNKSYGPNRNSYYEKVGKKLGINDGDLEHADQKVKPIIKEKVIKSRLFSTLSSYLWAATGVGIAMQKPWEGLKINPIQRLKDAKYAKKLAETLQAEGKEVLKEHKHVSFIKEFGEKFVQSCKEFVNNSSKSTRIAGRALLGAAIGMTLLGNFSTLFDFNKYKGRKTHASSSLIDESKEKVVC